MVKPSELTEADVRAIRASGEPATALAGRYGTAPAMIGRIQQRQIRKDVQDMAEETENAAVEGAEPEAPEAEAPPEPEITERQHLEQLAGSLGVVVDPNWSETVLKQAVADAQIAMQGQMALPGADLTYIGLKEGDDMVKVACAVRNVHLGDGQKLTRWQTAWVPPRLADALDGPCVAPEVAEALQRTAEEREKYE